jgi:hypothetical protein
MGKYEIMGYPISFQVCMQGKGRGKKRLNYVICAISVICILLSVPNFLGGLSSVAVFGRSIYSIGYYINEVWAEAPLNMTTTEQISVSFALVVVIIILLMMIAAGISGVIGTSLFVYGCTLLIKRKKPIISSFGIFFGLFGSVVTIFTLFLSRAILTIVPGNSLVQIIDIMMISSGLFLVSVITLSITFFTDHIILTRSKVSTRLLS